MTILDFLTIWGSHLEYLVARLDWMVVFGAILIVGAIVIFWKMARGRGSFDFAEMFEGEDRKTSMAKFLGFVGGLTSTYIVVALTTSGQLTEGYFAVYLGILVAGKVATEYVAAKKSVDTDKAKAGIQDSPPPDASVDLSMSVKSSGTDNAAAGPRRPLGRRAA